MKTNDVENIKIRKAEYNDAEGITKVHIKAWQESYKGIISDAFLANITYEKGLTQWQDILSNSDNHKTYFVAIDNNEIIGFAGGGMAKEAIYGAGEMYIIYLLEQYKGRGLGSNLWEACCQFLADKGLTPFYVWVLEANLPACKFYEKHGGKVAGYKIEEIGSEYFKELRYIFS